jgi:hypothetical protein
MIEKSSSFFYRPKLVENIVLWYSIICFGELLKTYTECFFLLKQKAKKVTFFLTLSIFFLLFNELLYFGF